MRPKESPTETVFIQQSTRRPQPAWSPPLGESRRQLSQQDEKGSWGVTAPRTPECLIQGAARAGRIRGLDAHSLAIFRLSHLGARARWARPAVWSPLPCSTPDDLFSALFYFE